ncbi:MAG: hypothetical protein G01um101419_819 [Parcubacteria group bacterium Gr01-1014_19]|nr:MAG: hypothetical protein G01um101419_819 [Parcubacteria group bacterium Gr01-1014_19]
MIEKDPYEEALYKASIMEMLLRKFFDNPDLKEADDQRKNSMFAALILKDEIEAMGFPVDYMITYFYPYQLGHRSRVCVGVTVHRPPKNGTPE